MTAQHLTWAAAGVSGAIVVVSGLADWRRLRRKRIDDYGWMPWRGIQVAAVFATVALAILAFKGG